MIESRQLLEGVLRLTEAGDPPIDFPLTIWTPLIDGARYACRFRIQGVPCGEGTRAGYGADGMRALWSVFQQIRIIAAFLPVLLDRSHLAVTFADNEPVLAANDPLCRSIRSGFREYRALRFPNAIELLLPFAESGVAELQLVIGSMHHLGEAGGIPINTEEAIRWLTAAAAQGNGQAFGILAEIYGRRSTASGDHYDTLCRNCVEKAIEHGFRLADSTWCP
jgi:hypothetical protein